jgi:Tol biopolymer transport system component
VLLPTGAGEMKVLEKGSIDQYTFAKWFPDGKRILFSGRESGRLDRCYLQQVDSGGPQPITPEGVSCTRVSPDGKSLIGFDPQNKAAIYSIEGAVPRPIPGLANDEAIAGWNADGSALYVYSIVGFSLKISKLDLANGRKEPLREVTPADTAGLAQAPSIILTPDGKGYIYTTRRFLMDLYLAEGLK